ncbi:flagellar biosynthesis anti-sigma factor FlgM [Novosphingobium sp. Chol11]|uniref:flagellar biosynthesis anti-sigma factor FlgM n=1 Tax=Novosphingobium sp. Chol11 TaxID=1385763 RepID=UPI0025F2EFF2|nr:flagellar biosynthesis anti-sigma factor FlgM [Novosphingobium sp. Chol11]
MSSFEIGAARPVGAVQGKPVNAPASLAVKSATPSAVPAENAQPGNVSSANAPQIATSDAVKAGEPPVDAERVLTIRRAIETGKYPITPAKIADAMIAAGILLRSHQ